mmetsp:Transcript_10591/g.11682  ORF Transcript_10591/g.11682 Transcript_10591/m.11682 type:complete len:213 (-) Transcript_10591:382-1020(-)|eukprot:Skav214314  [mRNA]  locus=scaffold998:258634:259272:+ [translate_table: standard]
MPPIAQVLHSEMMSKTSQTRPFATLHLLVVLCSAVSHGKDHHLVVVIQFAATMDASKEADVGNAGFETLMADDILTSLGGSTMPSDTGAAMVAHLAALTKSVLLAIGSCPNPVGYVETSGCASELPDFDDKFKSTTVMSIALIMGPSHPHGDSMLVAPSGCDATRAASSHQGVTGRAFGHNERIQLGKSECGETSAFGQGLPFCVPDTSLGC